jgi:predicted aconitase
LFSKLLSRSLRITVLGLPGMPSIPAQLRHIAQRLRTNKLSLEVEDASALCAQADWQGLLQKLRLSDLNLLTDTNLWLRSAINAQGISYAVMPQDPARWLAVAQQALVHLAEKSQAPQTPPLPRWQWVCESCDHPECEQLMPLTSR